MRKLTYICGALILIMGMTFSIVLAKSLVTDTDYAVSLGDFIHNVQTTGNLFVHNHNW